VTIERAVPRPTCCRAVVTADTQRPCNRKPLWHIRGIGYLCHYHYESMFESSDIDVSRVRRLSDSDRGFVVRCEPGTKHGSRNGGVDGRHHRPDPAASPLVAG
jgi:hypothetical protein